MALSCIVCEIYWVIGRKLGNFYTPPVFITPHGVTPSEFVKMFDADKTRMIGLPYSEKNYDNMLSRFHLIAKRHGQTDRRTDGRTDGETDRIDISISRVSVPTRNNYNHILSKHRKSLIFYIQHNSKQLTGTYYGT